MTTQPEFDVRSSLADLVIKKAKIGDIESAANIMRQHSLLSTSDTVGLERAESAIFTSAVALLGTGKVKHCLQAGHIWRKAS